jgi:hypothetical protein
MAADALTTAAVLQMLAGTGVPTGLLCPRVTGDRILLVSGGGRGHGHKVCLAGAGL